VGVRAASQETTVQAWIPAAKQGTLSKLRKSQIGLLMALQNVERKGRKVVVGGASFKASSAQ